MLYHLEVQMNARLQIVMNIVIAIMGIAIIVIGIVKDNHSATVIGMIVAAINAQQWMKWKRQRSKEEKG
jgi:hypothetical protein